MRNLILALALITSTTIVATAQADYNKGEFFVGFSHNQVDSGIDSGDSVNSFFRDRIGFNGFETSGVYNVNRYVGIKGDISGTYNSTQFTFPIGAQNVTVDTKNSLYNFLGGLQIKDNAREGRFKPFAHALIGAGHGRTKVNSVSPCTSTPTFDCSDITSVSDTGLAGAFGGGLDIRLNDRVDLRAFQVDYNPIKFENSTDHNVRFSIGFVIK